MLIVYDVLFGTRRTPGPDTSQTEVGLPGIQVPQTYASHLRLPFVWSRLQRDAQAS